VTDTANRRVLVEPWSHDHSGCTIGGSLYAVEQRARSRAAQALAAAGCDIHADVILDEHSRHRGVTWSELSEVRRLLPNVEIDLHLINLGQPRPTQLLLHLERAIQAAVSLRCHRITVVPAQIGQHRDRLDRLRAAGHQLWAEVSPREAADTIKALDVDGALVMLIEPGSKDQADLQLLDKVTQLRPSMSVGVDGGVTRRNARACQDAGASYLVSGRDLLTTCDTDHALRGSRSTGTKGLPR